MATLIGKMMVKHQIWSTIWTNPKDEGSLKIWVGYVVSNMCDFPTFFRFCKLTHHVGKGLKPPTSEWCKSKMSKNAGRSSAEDQKTRPAIPNFTQWLSRNGSFQNSYIYIYNLGSSIGFIKLELHKILHCQIASQSEAQRRSLKWLQAVEFLSALSARTLEGTWPERSWGIHKPCCNGVHWKRKMGIAHILV